MLRGFPAVRPTPPECAAVADGLLIGEYPNPEDAAWLRDTHAVTAVVSVQDDADLASKHLRLDDLQAAYRAHAVQFHHLPVADNDAEALAARLPALVALLGELIDGGARVYLHCNAGMNRAPTIAIAYLHVRYGVPLEAAAAHVKRCRPAVPYWRALDACYGPVAR